MNICASFYIFIKENDKKNYINKSRKMKIFITILGLLNGIYMLLDGIFVMIYGKFIGPEKPGPWANVFYKFNFDVLKLGPLFIVFGVLWIFWLYGLWANQSWTYLFGLVICILTFWYLPIGTFTSLIIIGALLLFKKKLGL